MERDLSIDAVKGVAIIAVVVGHVCTSYYNSGLWQEDLTAKLLCDFVYSFHMPLFFIVSGYLSSIKKITHNNIKQFILNKIVAYGIPYITFSIIDFLFKILFKSYVNSPVSVSDLCLIFIYPIGILWFLYALLLISIVHAIMQVMFINSRIRCIIEVVLAFLLLFITNNFVYSELGIYDAAKFLIWYIVGVYGMPHLIKTINTKTYKALSIIGFIVFFIIETLWSFYNIDGVFGTFINFFITGIGCIAVYSIVAYYFKHQELLDYLGKNTMPIYLMHAYFISVIRIVVEKTEFINDTSSIVKILICTFVGVVIPLIIYSFIKRVLLFDAIFYPSKYYKIK